MQLNVPDILKEVCLGVLVGEGDHVREPRVGGVRADQVGQEGDTFVTGKLQDRGEEEEVRRGGERRGGEGEGERSTSWFDRSPCLTPLTTVFMMRS